MSHQICHISENLQSLAFEKQLREIDEAIMGEDVFSKKSSSVESVPAFLVNLQNLAQSSRISKGSEKWDKGVKIWAGLKEELGPKYGLSGVTTFISQNGNKTTAHETMGCNSIIGQHTPMPQRGKENRDVGTRGKLHREKIKEDTSMEVEASDVGVKRKERIPLEDISADEESGKKQKLEGEVMALGKIMAKHLGSALAADQPRREQ
nr:hypothetical protein CFP56_63681 [Quercus suber]